jgi:glycosyltransferase involved in cell wall biosynthesis
MATQRLVGGIVAHNEERRIGPAIRSLLSQELPPGAEWQRIVVVASGCSDRTVEVARAVDPRVEVLEEADRRGKAAALGAVFGRSAGADLLVLLNGDALALPGAVAELLRAAEGREGPWVAISRPVPPDDRWGHFSDSIRLLWEIHNDFDAYIHDRGEASTICDELLLLPVGDLPPMPEGIVNDGGFIGAWLNRGHHPLLYVPSSRVAIESARRFRDHLTQRRRIRFGHRQVADLVGIPPMTWQRFALAHPAEALGFLRGVVRKKRGRYRLLLVLAAAEGAALMLAMWDRIPPRRNHAVWLPLPEE